MVKITRTSVTYEQCGGDDTKYVLVLKENDRVQRQLLFDTRDAADAYARGWENGQVVFLTEKKDVA